MTNTSEETSCCFNFTDFKILILFFGSQANSADRENVDKSSKESCDPDDELSATVGNIRKQDEVVMEFEAFVNCCCGWKHLTFAFSE